MAETSQSYDNHTKLVPMFHYVTLPILMINFVVSAYGMVTGFSLEALLGTLVALALVISLVFGRVFALGAQDRVIRLEEQMRMQRVLPDDLKSRVADFTTEQLIALRFCPDDELPDLSRKVLDDGIPDRKTIKQMIKTWRPDQQRL